MTATLTSRPLPPAIVDRRAVVSPASGPRVDLARALRAVGETATSPETSVQPSALRAVAAELLVAVEAEGRATGLPAPTDSDAEIVTLRTLARLAERTARQEIDLDPRAVPALLALLAG